MKSFLLFLSICAFFLTLIFTNTGVCGLVLTQGESYTFEFTSLPYHSAYTEDHLAFSFVDLTLITPDAAEFRFSVYENSTEETPIRSELCKSSTGYLEPASSTSWQDLQGIFQINVINGIIELESFRAATVIGNSLYKQTFTVPIPQSGMFILVGVLGMFFAQYARRKLKFIL